MKSNIPFVFLCSLLLSHAPARAEEGGFADYVKAQEKKAGAAEPEAKADPEKKEAKAKKEKKKKKEKKASEEPKAEPAHAEPAHAEPAHEKHAAKAEEHHAPKAAPAESEERNRTPSGGAAASTMPAEELSSVIVKTGKQCLVLEYQSPTGGVIPCTVALPLKYTKRDCASSQVQEIGDVDAQVSCSDKKRIQLRFRTSSDAVLVTLISRKQSEGRAGVVTTYAAESAGEEESSLAKLLPEPKLRSLEGKVEEESPLKLKFSGFASLEWEQSRRFGFDGTTAKANFDAINGINQQSNLNFLTNFGFEATRDQTSLVSLFEIGEVYFGDSGSGGAQGARATNVFEVRNLYLSHGFSDWLSFKGGVVTTASDPRSFIFSDHVASLQGNYKSDLSEGLLWYADSAKNKASAAHSRDKYMGAMGTLGFLTAFKATVYGVYRQKDGDQLTSNDGTSTLLTGDSTYTWVGATVDAEPIKGMNLQLTGIGNWVKTRLSDGDDKYNASLLDAKVAQAWGDTSIVTTLEGLTTTGAKGVTDSSTSKQTRGKRKNFVSPVAAAYLFTIATSDGVDDSPGTPKETTIANLNQDEGLRILAFTVNANLTRKISGFVRYGYLNTEAGSAATNKKHLGQEVDVGAQYQLTPSTISLLDHGVFYPGDFFSKRDSAQLTAAKLKFSF